MSVYKDLEERILYQKIWAREKKCVEEKNDRNCKNRRNPWNNPDANILPIYIGKIFAPGSL
jgi:hypothetical protein